MEISESRREDIDEIVDFIMTRTPQQDRVILRSVLNQNAVRSRRVLLARESGGALAGVSVAQAAENLPAGLLTVMVSTRADQGGRGLGSRLHTAALADLPDEVTQLVTAILDGDRTSLDVARHWGYTSVQRSMTVACALADATAPEPPSGDFQRSFTYGSI